jgi:transposase
VFIDETGSHLAMARLYARAPRGQRAYARKPHDRGRVQTIIGALGLDGFVAALTFTGFLDKEAFEVFVRDVLVPALQPGQVVVLDRLNVHKKKATLALIEAAGARVLFLPRATPELNPIEHCWAKIKAFLRRCAPRTLEDLELAIEVAMASITAHDCWGFFAGCGYL